MDLRNKKGSISIFVLVMLLFMSAFLIISYAANVNKSKTVKEQFNIISKIYSYNDGDEGAYDKAYTDLRNKNKQKMQASSETDTLELTKTFNENLSNYKIYGNSIQRLLPDEYQQVEYIESTGTQYIELDYIASNITNSKGKYKITNTTVANMLFGSRISVTSNFYGLNWGGGTPWTYYNSYNSGIITSKTIDEETHTFYKNKEKLYIDDELISTHTNTADFTTPYNMIVFGCNTNGTKGLFSYARIYYLQFYDNDELKVNLIPCYRKYDNVIGMYDLVENKFYTNKGTGTFLKGSNITSHPTPDYPQEVQSVGQIANFLKKENFKSGFISMTKGEKYTVTTNSSYPNTTYSERIYVKQGDVIKFNIENYEAQRIRIRFFDESDINTGAYSAGVEKLNITADGYIVLLFLDTLTDDVKLEAYKEVGAKYEIPIKLSGKNLFDGVWNIGYIDHLTGEVNENHKKFAHSKNFIKIEPNTNYYYSETTNTLPKMVVDYYDENKKFIQQTTPTTGSFKSLNNAHYIKIRTYEADEKYKNKLVAGEFKCQIEKGNKPTDYEEYKEPVITKIYINEPLRKVGDNADYIDFKEKLVVKNIKEKILNSNDKLSAMGRGIAFTESVDILRPTSTLTLPQILCSHYEKTEWANTMPANRSKEGICINSSANLIGFYDSIYANNLETFKTFLDNNEIKIYYQLATPIEERIDLPTISAYEDYTKIEVLTELDPSKIEVEYIGYTLE